MYMHRRWQFGCDYVTVDNKHKAHVSGIYNIICLQSY